MGFARSGLTGARTAEAEPSRRVATRTTCLDSHASCHPIHPCADWHLGRAISSLYKRKRSSQMASALHKTSGQGEFDDVRRLGRGGTGIARWSTGPAVDTRQAKAIESRLSELAKEYDSRFAEWHRENISAKNRDEREKAAKTLRPDPVVYAQRFSAAQEDPKSPNAFDALNRAILCGRGEPANAAVDQLRRDWTNSPRMAEVMFPVGSSMSPNAENLLREVIAKNTDRGARGPAVLVLATLLEGYAAILMHRNESPEKAQLLEPLLQEGSSRPDLDGRFDRAFGESESLYSRAHNEFGDVKLSPTARAKQSASLRRGGWTACVC